MRLAWNQMLRQLEAEAARQNFPRPRTLAEAMNYYYVGAESLGCLPFLEPRRVVAPGAYPPFKLVAGGLGVVLEEVMLLQSAKVQPAPTQITALGATYDILRNGVPTYFVAEAFARAVAATELGDAWRLEDLHWPAEAMCVAFPSRFMQEYVGRDVGYIYAARMGIGDRTCPIKAPLLPLPVVSVPFSKLAWFFHAYDVEHFRLESYAAAYRSGDRLNEVIGHYAYTDYTDGPQVKVEEDGALLDKISSLMLKLLMILNLRPALVVAGGIQRAARVKHGRVRSALWSPTIIGAAYRLQASPGTGTHASPRFHLRRGHLTHQRKGVLRNPEFVPVSALPRKEDGEIAWDQVSPEQRQKFWACHEVRWIEPCLINLDEEAGTGP